MTTSQIICQCALVSLLGICLIGMTYCIIDALLFPYHMRKDFWKLLHKDPENICRREMRNCEWIFREDYITKEMQEYVILQRPDLINKIPHLRFGLDEKYKDELNLSNIEI